METKYIVFIVLAVILIALIYFTKNRNIDEEVELSIDVKEEEKVIQSEYPVTLREWLAYTKQKKLSIEELKIVLLDETTCNFLGVYDKLKGGFGAQRKAEYLFNQWNTPKKPRVKKVTPIETVVAPTKTKKPRKPIN